MVKLVFLSDREILEGYPRGVEVMSGQLIFACVGTVLVFQEMEKCVSVGPIPRTQKEHKM